MTDNQNFDLNSLLEQAQALQEKVAEAQEQQANQSVSGSAGGGKVGVEMKGSGSITAISIDPSVVDPNEVEMLEDLIMAALGDAASKVKELQEETMGELDIPDIDGLGGMLGSS